MAELTGSLGGSAVGGGFGGALIPGAPGHTPILTVGSVSTLPSGSSAVVTLSQDEEGNGSFSFQLPAGAQGLQGARGPGSGAGVLVPTLYHRPRTVEREQGALLNITAGRIYLAECLIPEPCKLDRLRAWNGANTVLSGKSLKYLVYSAGANGMPKDRLYASGAVSLSNASSVYLTTGIGLSLQPGRVWIGCVFDSSAASGSNFATLLTRLATVTDDPTDTLNGCWDGVSYDGSSYASPQASDLDATLTRARCQYTNLPVILFGLTTP